MKLLLFLFVMISLPSFANTAANCELVDGIYQNSSIPLSDLKFETVVDIFTIKNANILSMNLDDEEIRFVRTYLKVERNSKLIYIQRRDKKAVRAVHIMIDRTPKKVAREREFYGNMIISPEMKDGADIKSIHSKKNLVYNFYCKF